jgi:hypothetical protein
MRELRRHVLSVLESNSRTDARTDELTDGRTYTRTNF